MPRLINGIEYLTTQEAMELTGMSRSTWRIYAEKYKLQHYTQIGKSRRYLWQRSDVEKLLAPMPVER